VHAAVSYAAANRSEHTNRTSSHPIGEIFLVDTLTLTYQKEANMPTIRLDNDHASFGHLKWTSGDESIVHVTDHGQLVAVGKGETWVTCSTLDESISVSILVICEDLKTFSSGHINLQPNSIIIE